MSATVPVASHGVYYRVRKRLNEVRTLARLRAQRDLIRVRLGENGRFTREPERVGVGFDRDGTGVSGDGGGWGGFFGGWVLVFRILAVKPEGRVGRSGLRWLGT